MSCDTTEFFSDPRCEFFQKPSLQRWEKYKEIRKEAKKEKLQAKQIYLQNKKQLEEKKQSLILTGTKKGLARKIVAPLSHSNKVRYENKKEEAKRKVKDANYLIEPFHWFYKVVNANGTLLLKPQGHLLLSFFIIVCLFVVSQFFLRFETFRFNGTSFANFISKLFGPQTEGMSNLKTWPQWFSYMGNVAIPLIWQTFEMMFVATALGSLIAIPFMILCSSNIVQNKPVNGITKFFLNVIRTIPTPVLGIMGVAFFNIGETAGVFAMTVFTAGIIIKIMYEYIETVDMHPYEAILSTGATKPKAFVSSIFPQIIPVFFSNIVYTFEINIRASVILGYVNAGGIGKEIDEALNNFQFNKIGAILIPLFVLVFALQLFSNWLKRRTQ